MAEAAQRKFDVVVVYKVHRFGRSVLRLNQQLATLTAHRVRFIATSQSLDTDQQNPTSRLLLQILASVAEFEREMIRKRTVCGILAAKAKGKEVGRPKRISTVTRWCDCGTRSGCRGVPSESTWAFPR